MGFFKMMKINARRALSGFWGRAILAMLIMALPTIPVSYTHLTLPTNSLV